MCGSQAMLLCAKGFCHFSLAGMTKFKCERKNEIDSGSVT